MSFLPRSRSNVCNVAGGALGIILIVVLLLGILSVSVVQVLANGVPTEVWVNDDWSGLSSGTTVDGHTIGYDAFATIQDGIDNVASGGTVHVMPGEYLEQLMIDKPLTLKAEGSGVVVKPPSGTLTTYSVTYDIPGGTKTRTFAPLIMVKDVSGDVVIDGLIIDGNYELLSRGYQGTDDPIYTGIVYSLSNGEIRNCEIKNFRPRPDETDLFNNGFAIWVVGYSEVLITGNNIHDYGWMGIVVDGLNYDTVTIEDNTITGWGPTIQTGQNGIQVSRGAYAKIFSNTITDNVYTGEDWWASGIIFYDGLGEVVGNLIKENQVGIDGIGGVTDIHIHFNNIFGNTYAGVYNEDGGTLDATYNWWGDSEGPTVETPPASGDSVYGDVDYTPWLKAPLDSDPDGTGVIASKQSGTDETLEFPDSGVDIVVTGSANVYVATYASNPGAAFTGDIGNYIDVYVPDVGRLTELEIRKHYTDAEINALGLAEGTLRLYWWNGTDWVACSDTGVNVYENYIWARIRDDTTPSLADLTGAAFGAAGKSPVGGEILSMNETALVMLLIQKNLGCIVLTALAIVAVVAAIKRRR